MTSKNNNFEVLKNSKIYSKFLKEFLSLIDEIPAN